MSLLDDNDSFTISLESKMAPTTSTSYGGEEGKTDNVSSGRVSDVTGDVQKFSLRRKKDRTAKKSHSRTPPDSPKMKSVDMTPISNSRKGTGAGKSNIGNTKARKHYSTLMENDDSSPDNDDEVEDNFLLSKGHVAREKRSSSNSKPYPSLSEDNDDTAYVQQFPVRFTPPTEAKFSSNDISTDDTSDNTVHMTTSVSGGFDISNEQFSLPPPFPVSAPLFVDQSPDEPDWSVSDELYQKCVHQFESLWPENGYLSGEKARDFFLKSRLPVDELSKIWKLSDIDHDGRLSLDEFVIAMKLVLMRRKSYNIPIALPSQLIPKSAPSQITMPIEKLFERNTQGSLPPPRPPPPSFLSSTNRTKTEPTIAVSDATPIAIDTTSSLINFNDESEVPPLEPSIARLISLQEESSTGTDEDETSALVGIEAGPVPKPRRKKRSPVTKKDPPGKASDVQKSTTVRAPPGKPAPYQGQSPLHKSVTSSTATSEVIENIDTNDIIKGHGRSTSWDLTKLLKDGSLSVHDDLPSAEPPKLPPRKNVGSPCSDDEGGKVTTTGASTIQRSASTGSIASIGNTNVLNISTTSRSPSNDSVGVSGITEPLPLISRSGSDAVRRPAPAPPTKVKPKKPMYPPIYKKIGNSPEKVDNDSEKVSLSMESYKKKTKIELQKSIKQLKEENDVYVRMNDELSKKLQELLVEKNRLELKLESIKNH